MLAKTIKEVNLPVTLAPMVGLSHVAFRLMLRDHLPKGAKTLWPTEMLNSRRVPKQDLSTNALSLKGPSEAQMWPQILGNEPEPIYESIQCLKKWGAEAIDINMGCPVKKALRHNYGVSLMGDIKYASEVVKMAVRSSDLPVSVKIRAGFQNDQIFLKDFVLALEDAGASWLTLHPRLASEKRRGRADWGQIHFIKEILDIPVIGNGDIQTEADIFSMMEQTGCDLVMIGRALTAKPWLLTAVALRQGFTLGEGEEHLKPPETPAEEAVSYGRALSLLLEYTEKYYEERLGLVRFKFFVKTSHVWLNFGHSLHTKIRVCKTYAECRRAVEAFFTNTSLAMSQKTDLRE